MARLAKNLALQHLCSQLTFDRLYICSQLTVQYMEAQATSISKQTFLGLDDGENAVLSFVVSKRKCSACKWVHARSLVDQ